MRRRTALILSSAAGIAAAILTPALAAAGAAYTTLPLRDAVACARACADDGLCIVWIQRPQGGCELSATAPRTWPTDGAAFGLSSRAPSFIVLPTADSTSLSAPVGTTENIEAASSPDAEDSQPPDESAPDYALLGGPDEDALRLRLGGTQ